MSTSKPCRHHVYCTKEALNLYNAVQQTQRVRELLGMAEGVSAGEAGAIALKTIGIVCLDGHSAEMVPGSLAHTMAVVLEGTRQAERDRLQLASRQAQIERAQLELQSHQGQLVLAHRELQEQRGNLQEQTSYLASQAEHAARVIGESEAAGNARELMELQFRAMQGQVAELHAERKHMRRSVEAAEAKAARRDANVAELTPSADLAKLEVLFCVVPPPSQGFLHALLEDQAACRRSRRGFPRLWCKPVLAWCASVWLVKPGAYEQMAAGRVLSLPSVWAVKRHAKLTQSASGHSRELLERVKQLATRLETAKQREVSLPISLGGAAPGRRARARAHDLAILIRGDRRLQSKVTGGCNRR